MQFFYVFDVMLRCFPEPVFWLISIVFAVSVVVSIFKLIQLILDAIPFL